MFRNYLKIAFRNIIKQKFYSSLNILGLALGIACCLLILLYIRDELNYDKYHEKSVQIYRLSTGYIQENGLEAKVSVIPAMWAPTLKSEFPEVLNFVRFYKYRSDILVQSKENEKSFYEGNFFWADSTVLDIFTFPVVEGNPETALAQPNSVVISQTMAEKYFGDESPIGRNLTYVNRSTVFELQVTGVIAKQLDFFKQRRLGLDEGVIISIPLRGNVVYGQYANYKNEILQNTNIVSAAASSHIPFTDHKQGRYKLPEILGSEVHFESDYFVVDPDFGKLFNLEIVNGRNFSVERDGISDSKSFILNERAVQTLGLTNAQAIGKHIDDPFWQASGQIVGVVRDFHYRSMHKEIGPLVIKMDPRFVRFLSVKISALEFKNKLKYLEKKWLTFFPDSPFYYTFLDDDLNHLYKSEEKMGELFNIFSAIAIVISCLGLFGLASFSAEQRTKEIGVRKVLGASVVDVIILLTKDFTKLIIAAFLVAMPCAALFSKICCRSLPTALI